MLRILLACLLLIAAPAWSASLTDTVAKHYPNIIKGSVKTAGPVIADILAVSGDAPAAFLENWQNKDLWFHREDEYIVTVSTADKKTYTLFDIETGAEIAVLDKKAIKQIKPNSGLRAMIGSALVTGRLTSEDISVRRAALKTLGRDPDESHLEPLRAALKVEKDPSLLSEMKLLEPRLTLQFAKDDKARVAAIESFAGDLSVGGRASLNRLLSTSIQLEGNVSEGANIAGPISPGSEALSIDDAYDLLIDAGLATPIPTAPERRAALEANIVDGSVGGVPVSELGDPAKRQEAYLKLAEAGAAPEWNPALSKEVRGERAGLHLGLCRAIEGCHRCRRQRAGRDQPLRGHLPDHRSDP